MVAAARVLWLVCFFVAARSSEITDLCSIGTYQALMLAQDSDAMCQLWLDAGHSCTSSWADVCPDPDTDTVSMMMPISALSDIGCAQCSVATSTPTPGQSGEEACENNGFATRSK